MASALPRDGASRAVDGRSPVRAAPAEPATPAPAATPATPETQAIRAFDAAADVFDQRFGDWASVAAQRRAVRRHLLEAFPEGSRLLELGGGTGEDALFLARNGRSVLLTDGSPRMLERAREKAGRAGLEGRLATEVLALEDIEAFARERRARGQPPFDGVYSNFAALNCVPDLGPVARGLAVLLGPGAHALLVLFGPLPPGEILVQLLRGHPRAAFRRLRAGPVPARLGGVHFHVWYPGPRRVRRAFEPGFRAVSTHGVGILVPPSAAEPAISRHPRLVSLLERIDRLVERPLAALGDHVLLRLERTAEPAAPAGPPSPDARRRFRAAYARHREAEGRGAGGPAELLALPYLREGPQAGQWAVRARTFDRFIRRVLEPRARAVAPRPLHVLDLGAGSAWLAQRAMRAGHRATAIDVRTDDVDGLGAAAAFAAHPAGVPDRVGASFEDLPVRDGVVDIAVFNASLHYAFDLAAALAEARRTLAPEGRIVILDSPFYRAAADGDAMVAEKRRQAAARFGELAEDLAGLPFIEYLTPERLRRASEGLGLRWRRHRVRYPLSYELRTLIARLRGRRRPSRFDLWEGLPQ